MKEVSDRGKTMEAGRPVLLDAYTHKYKRSSVYRNISVNRKSESDIVKRSFYCNHACAASGGTRSRVAYMAINMCVILRWKSPVSFHNIIVRGHPLQSAVWALISTTGSCMANIARQIMAS